MPFQSRMRSLPFSRVRVTDPFWTGYQQRLIEDTLPAQYEQILKTNRLANFRRAAGAEEGTHEGIYFNDSDVYKFVEACAYALAVAQGLASRVNPHPGPLPSKGEGAYQTVRRQMDEAIEAVEAAQMPDGYIGTFFQLKHPDLRWRNLSAMHEMYCGGHLIEAAVAVFEALGERKLLDVAIRLADHVMTVFGPDKRRGYCGHEEIELALIRLSEATGDGKYREFARWMVEERGKAPSPFKSEMEDEEAMSISPWMPGHFLKDGVYSGEYFQDHAPIREHTEIVGHAVRSMYFYIAATQLADGQDDIDLETALERIWNNLTRRRMYITGGIGPSAKNEGFTADYDLPNLTAYAETCAAIGLVFWGRRLLEMTANAEYADLIERALYNGVISGISLDGTNYFYDNPLESWGQHQRVPWFGCACCPPNIARLLGSVARYVVAEADEAFYVHMPVALTAETCFGGTPVTLSLEGDYPWSGRFQVRVEPAKSVRFALKVRIPDWSEEVETELPGATEEAGYESGYAVFDRVWNPGDVLTVDLGMRPKWMEADPRVRDDLGRVALQCGPLVYCAQETDLGYAPQLLAVDPAAELPSSRKHTIEVFEVPGIREVQQPSDQLYAELGTTETEEATARFIPYYSWGNKGATSMAVWFRRV